MQEHAIYTIGHGTRTADLFLALLKEHGIEYLIDVRSKPFSRFNPQYNQDTLNAFLEANGVKYVFMGDELGGRPKDPLCYDNYNKVNYEIVKTRPFFLNGIERLKKAYDNKSRVAIMCSESKPLECHRTRLISVVLEGLTIPVQHIDEKGVLKNHTEMFNDLSNQKSKNLFD